ncbi:flagellar hook assembly protein FlgD [Anaeromyxobacter paludicola]|uniref:Basal-body rod modification protein FlgD n=1 Tax=Anaeromyxobacter paludicola TaxID=2918171 RepID=A0ABM7X7Z4_9BACT|nr:flagellar hook capping FlgD N-terminal domain-containing protein [Anaeromyxobacter paludicola]BDG07974.1 basal-body rod modification protein FlgD [Anaeromyxobacter paludicola]
MDTSAVNSTANIAGTTATTTGKSTLGKDDFLKLMLAQLQNQDPTQPVDNQAFVAQMAQFSSVEQLQNVNDQLGNLLLAQNSGNQMSFASMVGKDVLFNTDGVTLVPGQAAQVQASLADSADKVSAVITNASGKVVRTIQLGARQAGDLAVSWDGRDDDAQALPAGDYKIAVSAYKANGDKVGVTERSTGTVTGVRYENGAALLLVGGRKVPLSDVLEIDQHQATSTNAGA